MSEIDHDSPKSPSAIGAAEVERIFRDERSRVLAAVARAVRDLELAEDAVQDAFVAALAAWPQDGFPSAPAAWLTTAAKNRAISQFRRAAVAERASPVIEEEPAFELDRESIPDQRLALICCACHPALSEEARVALTLHTMCGLSTPTIARLFLQPEATVAQRLVRAKRKIRDANIPFEIPTVERLDERIEAVLAVVYLLFTAGYSPSDGDFSRGDELCEEALRLARVLAHLLPTYAELRGLTALMLLHHARRPGRLDAAGELRDLEEQDRSLWNRAMIEEGLRELEQALARGKPGPYQIQAAIAALHATATTVAATDWVQIMALYEELWKIAPSSAVAVSLALAEGTAFSPELGLARLEQFEQAGLLAGYDRVPAARADLLRRAGRNAEARSAYADAMSRARHGREQRFLQRRAERCV